MRQVTAITAGQIFEQHAAFVWRTLRYLGIRQPDVPDVAQEVFITVYRKLAKFDGRSTLRSWMYRICQRAASDHRRRAYVRREVVTEKPAHMVRPPPRIDGVALVEARSMLKVALDALDEPKRKVFVLYEIEGSSMREVADALDCPLQTAYSRLRTARRAITDTVE